MGTETQMVSEIDEDATPPWDAEGPATGKAVAVYDPFHPSVLFERLKRGWRKGFTDKLKRLLGRNEPARPAPKHSRIVGKDGGRRLLESGLVLPSQKDVFLLSRPDDAAEYLRQERSKLRRMKRPLARMDQ